MCFELLTPAEAKAYVKKPRLGQATFPFFNPDLMEEPAPRAQQGAGTSKTRSPEEVEDEISTGSVEGNA